MCYIDDVPIIVTENWANMIKAFQLAATQMKIEQVINDVSLGQEAENIAQISDAEFDRKSFSLNLMILLTLALTFYCNFMVNLQTTFLKVIKWPLQITFKFKFTFKFHLCRYQRISLEQMLMLI
jgi:hypothetical protein